MARNTAQSNAQAQTPANLSEAGAAALNAVNLATDALAKAQAMLEAAGVQTQTPANNSTNIKTSSGGRTPSAEQLKIRELITDWAASDKADLFTIKSMAADLGKDPVQTRNAIKYLTEQGVVVAWAEKFNEGRGNREHVYKPASFDVGI